MQEYLDKENNPVEVERWRWVAFYKDASYLTQFDDENFVYHYFDEIEQDKVLAFGLVSDGKQFIKNIPPEAKLIHYYDNLVHQPMGGSPVNYRLYCFGYQTKDEKRIWTILPTDVVIEGNIKDMELL